MASNSDKETKKDVLTNRYFSNYFMLVEFISPVKLSDVKSRAKFRVLLRKLNLKLKSLNWNQTFVP